MPRGGKIGTLSAKGVFRRKHPSSRPDNDEPGGGVKSCSKSQSVKRENARRNTFLIQRETHLVGSGRARG